MNTPYRLLLLPVLALTVASVNAGTFATITPDGDVSDWTGIAASYTGPTGGTVDVNQVFVANDANYLYLRVQFTSAINPNDALLSGSNNLFLSIDTDNNLSTGFNIFGLNRVGADVSWQNDFPFAQTSTTYNSGSITNGAAGIAPFAATTTEQEYRISLTATYTGNGLDVFPSAGNTIGIMFWSDSGASMATNAIAYSLASAIPEPATTGALAGLGVLALAFMRRRRQA